MMHENDKVQAVLYENRIEEGMLYQYLLSTESDCLCETCHGNQFKIRLEHNIYKKGELMLKIGIPEYDPFLFPTIKNVRQLGILLYFMGVPQTLLALCREDEKKEYNPEDSSIVVTGEKIHMLYFLHFVQPNIVIILISFSLNHFYRAKWKPSSRPKQPIFILCPCQRPHCLSP